MIKNRIFIFFLAISLSFIYSCHDDSKFYLTFSRAECSIDMNNSIEIFKVFEEYDERYHYVACEPEVQGQRLVDKDSIFKKASRAYIWLGVISNDAIIPSYSSRSLTSNLDCIKTENLIKMNIEGIAQLHCDSSSFLFYKLSSKYFLVFESTDFSLLQKLKSAEIRLVNLEQDMRQPRSELLK